MKSIGDSGKSSRGGGGEGKESSLSIVESNNRATQGMRDFLRTLSTEDLYGISKTSTGGLILPTSSEEAISIIIRYSDGISLLNRRRIKREDIAKYLHKENIRFTLPSNKTILCQHVLSHWGLNDSQTKNYNFQDEPTTTTTTPSSSSSSSHQSQYYNTRRSTAGNTRGPSLNSSQNSTSSSFYTDDDNRMEHEPIENNFTINPSSPPELPRQQTGQGLAEQFTSWFYNKWNNLIDFESYHFWPQCNLRVEVIQLGQETTVHEIYQNGEQCCSFLKCLVTSEQLVMNPNYINGLGIWGKINPHGLAQVIVCGTVLKNNSFFGIFEQVFGLIKDPNCENNFKIQFSVIRYKGGGGGSSMLETSMNPPTIRNSSLGCMIEEIWNDDE